MLGGLRLFRPSTLSLAGKQEDQAEWGEKNVRRTLERHKIGGSDVDGRKRRGSSGRGHAIAVGARRIRSEIR